ncbi:MAG: serine/threonine protein phosphatase [Robiginitomaculum sp.]|nr:MAG: serine/threonine protein phosphatase [Robiginitomaculum sp.]
MPQRNFAKALVLIFSLFSLAACSPKITDAKLNKVAPLNGDKVITLLFTNDVESAYDPIPAFWLDDIESIGGIAELTTLINDMRQKQPNVFLFDAGDIFTGSLAKETNGALAFDLMTLMDYDAMAIGNHEFEYGADVLAWQKNRAPFPVLAANIFYQGTDHPFAQAYTIVERNGVRIGVVGIMGRDAVSAIIPSFVAAVDVRDEVVAAQRAIDAIRGEVDIVVLLTHQGKTAPMQTDAESDPRLQRDIDADIALSGTLRGVDVHFAGHADAGTPEPLVHPKTGTLIMQTYGQATHLGFLQLTLDGTTGKIKSHAGKLIPVNAQQYKPNKLIAARLTEYRERFPELYNTVGYSSKYMSRRYIEESDVGNLFSDIMRAAAGTDIALLHAGSLRKDIPQGAVSRADLLDVYPFIDTVDTLQITGAQLREVLEQSLTLERGLLQISGFEISYDLSKPEFGRLVSMTRGGISIRPSDTLSVAAPSFLAEGGDLYTTFSGIQAGADFGLVSTVIIDYFAKSDTSNRVAPPAKGRQTELKRN